MQKERRVDARKAERSPVKNHMPPSRPFFRIKVDPPRKNAKDFAGDENKSRTDVA